MKRPLSRSRRAVLSYAEANPQDVAYLPARQLGERCGVSESTVIRAVQALGFDGYPEYQEQVRKNLSRHRTTVERLSADNRQDPLARVFGRDIENLRDTWAKLSPEALDRAAALLAKAPRVWVLGLRTPHAVAVLLQEGLSFLALDARLLMPGKHDIWDDVDQVKARDVVVAITVPRYTRLVVEAAGLAKGKGASLVAFTDGQASPLAAQADVLLSVSYELDGYVESLTAAVSLAQALLLEVARKMGPRASKALRKKESLWLERGVYWE